MDAETVITQEVTILAKTLHEKLDWLVKAVETELQSDEFKAEVVKAKAFLVEAEGKLKEWAEKLF